MSQLLMNTRSLLGAVAKWSVQQSPYHRPDNLELVLDKLHELTEPEFKKHRLGYMEFASMRDVGKFVSENLRQIPEYTAWNDRKNGDNSPYGFTSAYDGPGNPDDDFIDLDALERNVADEATHD